MYLFKNYVLTYSFNVFQQLDKEVLALYKSTISKLNITKMLSFVYLLLIVYYLFDRALHMY